MKRICFLSDQVYETGGPGKGPRFAAGSVLAVGEVGRALGLDVSREWAEGFLHRWVKRGVAEDVSDDRRGKAAIQREAEEGEARKRLEAELQRRSALEALAVQHNIDLSGAETEEAVASALRAAGVEFPAA